RSVLAHDPGLSAIDLKLDSGKLTVDLTFARKDIEAIVPIDLNRDGVVSADEFSAARAQLDAVGRETVEIGIDGRRLAPGKITITPKDGDAVHFQIAFDGATGAKLQLRSVFISKLAFGHKQYLTLHGNTGEAKGARMLDAKNNVYDIDLAAITEQPH